MWPNFSFVHADVYNRDYNPSGRNRADAYEFPFPDRTFDVVYAASLLTHLLPAETANYFRQIGRVLKNGGRALLSTVLLDHYGGPGTAIAPAYELVHTLPGHAGVAVRDAARPDAMIGYSRDALERLLAGSTLTILLVVPGLWSQNTAWAVNEHDLLLLRRER